MRLNSRGVFQVHRQSLVCGLMALCLLLAIFSAHGDKDSSEDLIGLWGSERSFGPELHGLLTIEQRKERWFAKIADVETAVAHKDGELRLAVKGDRGEFRGRLAKNGARILGHWIQPQSVIHGRRYATPVELTATERNVWRGQVVPLDDRVSIYIVIQATGDGTLRAFIRNPERNLGRYLRLGRVIREGNVVRFTGDRQGRDALVANFEKGVLSLSPLWGARFELTKRSRDNAIGFYPRTPEQRPYEYHQPIQLQDGWATATVLEVGLDPKLISRLVEHILNTETNDVSTPYVQGLLIARHGKLVLEEYFYGFDRDQPHDTRSAGKSLASTLMGIAIDGGSPSDVTAPVYWLFPRYQGFKHYDRRKSKMTVEHLLTMSSGFDCDDEDRASPGNEDRMQTQGEEPDWYKYTLDLPMASDPGERAVYCSAGINLLGGIISSQTGRCLPDFLYERFAQPLDIHRYHINLTPLGDAYMGGGIHMRPRDFIKLGQLFLAGGRWNGRRVISQKWIKRATVAHSSINDKNDYGYAWWIKEFDVGGKKYRGFQALGNGGQLVIVIPEPDLVVMFSAGNYGDTPSWRHFSDELVPQFIIAAVRS